MRAEVPLKCLVRLNQEGCRKPGTRGTSSPSLAQLGLSAFLHLPSRWESWKKSCCVLERDRCLWVAAAHLCYNCCLRSISVPAELGQYSRHRPLVRIQTLQWATGWPTLGTITPYVHTHRDMKMPTPLATAETTWSLKADSPKKRELQDGSRGGGRWWPAPHREEVPHSLLWRLGELVSSP